MKLLTASVWLLVVTAAFGPWEALPKTFVRVVMVISAIEGVVALRFVQRPPWIKRDGNPPEPLEIRLPVQGGPWKVGMSPSSGVPSHFTHLLAQTYAIDLLRSSQQERPKGWRRIVRGIINIRPARHFGSFGEPIFAVASGQVVHTSDKQRDHFSRLGLLGILYVLLLEGPIFRTMGGASRLIGNTVVLKVGDNAFAVFAHLKRGSIGVIPGEWVDVGTQIAECGNSGNSTDPHLHFQLMSGEEITRAYGLPFVFSAYRMTSDGSIKNRETPQTNEEIESADP